MNLSYHMPTRVIFGKNSLRDQAAEFGKHGNRAFIVTGKTSALKSGAQADTEEALSMLSIPYRIYNGVMPNPTVANIRIAASEAKDFKADFIIGIGGGSPMDAAKAVALLAVQDLDDASLFKGPYRDPLPIIAVPTTAGTGSEVTPYSILTDTKDETKKNLSHESLYPKAAFLDPSYTEMLPFDVTVNTAIDALSHALESFLSVRANAMSTLITLEALRLLGPCLMEIDHARPVSYTVRERLLFASMLAGMAIAQTGTTVVHAMGYALTYHRNIDHGKANGLLITEYMRYIRTHYPENVLRALDAMSFGNVEDLGRVLENLIPWNDSLTESELEMFSQKTLTVKSVVNTKPAPGIADIKRLYKRALGVK